MVPSPFLQFPRRQLPLVLQAATEKQIAKSKKANRYLFTGYLSPRIFGAVCSFTVSLPIEVGLDTQGFGRGIAILLPLADLTYDILARRPDYHLL